MPVDANGNATMATHVAVSNGDWFDPATWANGQIPNNGALVHIPKDVSVTYEGSTNINLFIVRVDGNLTFTAENGQATKMVVDTMITAPGSTLAVNARAETDGPVDIVFAETQPSAFGGHYTDHSSGDGVIGRYDWDPDQLSLGLVASGTVDIKGKDIDAKGQLATGPHAGEIEIALDMDLGASGWKPGQTIVIGGTKFAERNADATVDFQDEVRVIVDIRTSDGQMIVTLDRPLDYDHSGPFDPVTGQELTGFVGNLSRNVTFRSEVADGNGDGVIDRGVSLGETKGPGEHYVTERGHIMFMHNDDVSVHDIAVMGLGRTDKSVGVDDFQTTGPHDSPMYVNGGDNNAFEEDLDIKLETPADQIENMRGRYALHLHMANEREGHDHGHGDHGHNEMGGGVLGPCPETGGAICHCGDQDADGIADCLDDDVYDGAWIEGVSVWGTPGWGIVQHSTDAVLQNNVVYDAAGSAFVSETGDETGRWTDNLAIGTYGAKDRSDNNDAEHFNGDGGDGGNGFYMKSRAIDVSDNAAQSSARSGFFWHTEGGDLLDPQAEKLGVFGTTANYTETMKAERVLLDGFEDNTVIAARQGLRIVGSPEDSVRKFNDAYGHLKNFKGWEIDGEGVSITYSSKYIFENFLLLGTEQKISADAQQTNSGFYFKASVADITVLNSHVENFTNALTNWTQVGDRQEIRKAYWDPKFTANNPYVEFNEGMGYVDGIENMAYNLWNTNIVGLTWDNLGGGGVRVPIIKHHDDDGNLIKERGHQYWASEDEVTGEAGVSIELLGDSAAGGLVALWREDIANHPDQRAMLAEHIPLAYQNKVYLGQYTRDDGSVQARWNYGDYVEGINDDIWSGTVLEFAKTDSLGTHVFNYGDFSPLNPAAAERTVTTNERLVLAKEEVDAILVNEGYYSVRGVPDVKFVVMREKFSDRLTGETKVFEILVALDLAWEMPAGTKDGGMLLVHSDMLLAPRYHVFENGVLVQGREAITLKPPENTFTGEDAPSFGGYAQAQVQEPLVSLLPEEPNQGGDVVQLFGGDHAEEPVSPDVDEALDGYSAGEALFGGVPIVHHQGGVGRDEIRGGAGGDVIETGVGHDIAQGGAGDDTIDGGAGFDSLSGGDGSDLIRGGWGHDTIDGGTGDDVITGNQGNDLIRGGAGVDMINGGNRADSLFGGDGNDLLLGEEGADRMHGDDGDDALFGQGGWDRLFGGAGDDLLSGGVDGDRLFGGDGADRLAGGIGDDTLEGGAGADRFVFESGADMDVITDFEDGVDAIEFMVSSFGFDDLEILRDGDDAVVVHGEGQIRVVGTDADALTGEDFNFIGSG